VYRGQTVGWIKMKLGTEEGLCPSHIVLDGDPAPPPTKKAQPQLSAHVCCGQMAGWMPLGTEVSLGLGDIVLEVGSSSSSPKGGTSAPTFRPIYCGQTVGWIKMLLGSWYRGRPQPDYIVLDGDPATPHKKGHTSP